MNTKISRRRKVEELGHGDWQRLKQELSAQAPLWGIDLIGFTTAEPFTEMRTKLEEHRRQGRESGFEADDLALRTEPARSLPSAQSIIAIAIAYPAKLQDAPVSEPGAYRGVLCRAAWGEDYHRVLHQRLDKVRLWLEQRIEDLETVSMVDTGALVDRAVAVRAGIGWSGRNSTLISNAYGSWIYLGEMITNLPFPADQPLLDDCGECRICVDVCPTGALLGEGQLDSQKCIAFLTQTKTILPDHYKQKLGNRLYGCDTCQVVCPKNHGKPSHYQPEFEPDPQQVKPLLKPIVTASNRAFAAQFGKSAASWRGRKPLQRNAIIALGHYRDHSAAPLIRSILLEDPREALRDAAAWALGRLASLEALRALHAAAETEQHPDVQLAVNKAVQQIDHTVEYSRMDTPFGTLWLACTAYGVWRLRFGQAESLQWMKSEDAAHRFTYIRWRGGQEITPKATWMTKVREELESYFAGEGKSFSVPLDQRHSTATAFRQEVWRQLLRIPYGATISYKQLAVWTGSSQAARAVGSANGSNPWPILVPCHRVIAADGKLGGYSGGLDVKKALLDMELRNV